MTDTRTAQTAEQLAKQYGWWGSHPNYTASEWQRDAANGDTRLGYWQWVAALCDSEVGHQEG